MERIDWKRKLASRKFWTAVAGLAAGLIAAFGGTEAAAAQVTGLIMAAASVVAYIVGEGLVDASSAGEGREESPPSAGRPGTV